MAYLIDTSILARLANTGDTSYPVATHAVLELHRRGEVLHVALQNLVEFRNVATRPVALNGLMCCTSLGWPVSGQELRWSIRPPCEGGLAEPADAVDRGPRSTSVTVSGMEENGYFYSQPGSLFIGTGLHYRHSPRNHALSRTGHRESQEGH